MAIAILVGRDATETKNYDWFIRDWQRALLALDPNLDIQVWPDIQHSDEINFALVWQHPLGALKQFPNLKVIASLAAGVDHVLIDTDLSHHIPIVRVLDPYMANDIVQYVTACVLHYVKRMDHWKMKQQQKLWWKQPPFTLSDKTIGIMGLGFLGKKAAHTLHQLGLNVIGWSNSAKTLTDIKHFVGKAEFNHFLSRTNILVCMLPLTNETKNILNQDTFAHLPANTYLINVGRGEHLVEEDLLIALNAGQLSGASLDVFRQEPLPSDHAFWLHPNIRITPHIASVTNPSTAAPQILENYQRSLSGQALLNRIDLSKGY